ncbi:MAG: hypothetical protein ABI411_01000 [Tahibacter sp.]
MTRPSLSELYRRQTLRPTLSARALLDSETAVRAARGRVVPHECEDVATALAGSAGHADLVRMLRELEPASAELAQALRQQAPAHDLRERISRQAHPRRHDRRGWQWGAIAAIFVAAVALFAARSSVHGLGDQSALAQMPLHAVDGIFGSQMEPRLAQQDLRSDVIFHTDNTDNSDHIFREQLGGG